MAVKKVEVTPDEAEAARALKYPSTAPTPLEEAAKLGEKSEARQKKLGKSKARPTSGAPKKVAEGVKRADFRDLAKRVEVLEAAMTQGQAVDLSQYRV